MVRTVTKQHGFTLVEIAIVLVVIGLLLGGVMKGQEIIKNAKIKNIENSINGMIASVATYQERYHALPGDDPRADSRWSGAGKGDGDGKVENGNGTDEGEYFWDHLRRAGIIPGSGDAPPTHAFGGAMTVNYECHGIYNSVFLRLANITGEIAEIIDQKLDDGIPNSGSLRGHGSQTAYDPSGLYTLCVVL